MLDNLARTLGSDASVLSGCTIQLPFSCWPSMLTNAKLGAGGTTQYAPHDIPVFSLGDMKFHILELRYGSLWAVLYNANITIGIATLAAIMYLFFLLSRIASPERICIQPLLAFSDPTNIISLSCRAIAIPRLLFESSFFIS